jgi:hypothetical protein
LSHVFTSAMAKVVYDYSLRAGNHTVIIGLIGAN